MSGTAPQLKSQMIQAGAGAGKTTRLIETFFNFVEYFHEKHNRYPRLVISTFTKKATQELKERLFKKAIELGQDDILRMISKPSQVHISTLHGLLVPFLSRFGSRVGLNPEIQVVSTFQKELSDKRILKRIFQREPDLISILDEFSWSELMLGLEIYSQTRLEKGNFQFDSIELVKEWQSSSFAVWNQNRLDLQRRFSAELLPEGWRNYLSDYFAHLASWSETEDLFNRLPRKPQYKKDKPPFSQALHDDFEIHREQAKKILLNPLLQTENQLKFASIQLAFSKLAESFFQDTLKAKFESGRLSMSDLETLTLEVIRQDPTTARVFSQEWDFWMIDEYQDTAPIQVEILKNFTAESPQFIVGDPQQSIYLFRGARKEVFQEKVKEMHLRRTELETLDKNYRSRPELVNFFNLVFTRFSPDFVKMIPQREKGSEGTINVRVLLAPQEEAERDPEIQAVISQIQNLLKSGVQAKQIAVLARTNAALKKALTVARTVNLEVECPSLSDYWNRREILDLASLIQFMLNPFDNINMFTLLRSPWFEVSDEELVSFDRRESLWIQLKQRVNKKQLIETLNELLKHSQIWGLSSALLHFIEHSDFLWMSQYLDPSGRREANIWKFILEVRDVERQPGVNVLEWLDESLRNESLNIDSLSGEAPPLLEPNRVSFMTIHASKGLEFDHVFILGLSDRPRKSNNQIFSFSSDQQIFSVGFRNDENKWIYSPLAEKVRDEMRQRERDESLRWLYVAMTRARETLTLIAQEDSDPQSWWAAWPLTKEEGVHNIGEAVFENHRLASQELKTYILDKKPVFQKEPFQWISPESLSKSSVTALVENGQQEKKSTSLQGPVQALKKAQEGTRAHRLFESLVYREDLETIADEWKAPVQFLLELKSPPMKEILSKGHPEWGFAYQKQNQLIQGAIDLWAELEDRVYILDYKTGSSRHSDKAISQLELYSKALNEMDVVTRGKPHQLVAIYPFEEKVIIHDLLFK